MNRSLIARVALGILLAHTVGACLAFAQSPQAGSAEGEWPQFLGPNRNGISAETGLLEKFAGGEPKLLWQAPGGVGSSGLAVSRGRLLTLVQRQGKQRLIALRADSGELIWEAEIGPEYKNQMGNGPRATPTISGDTVYSFSGEGILSAHAFADGKLVWSKNVVETLGGKPAEYGMACSPLVNDGHVIVMTGAGKSVAAFEAGSGKLAWSSGDGDLPGYSSPALLEVGGSRQIVVYTGSSVLGLEPKSGRALWRYEYETDFGCNIATPLAVKGQVFISSGENHGSTLLALKAEGEKFTPSEVWSSLGPRSVLRNEWQTSILLDGYLYGLDNVGGAGPVTHLTCINAATGERMWQKPRFGKGNLIAADGKLFFSMLSGEVILVKASAKGYEELGRAEVTGPTRQAPALSGGRLYLRDDEKIYCLNVRQK